MNMTFISGYGVHGLLDWQKSEVYKDLKSKKVKFEMVDKNGKMSSTVNTENEIMLLL